MTRIQSVIWLLILGAASMAVAQEPATLTIRLTGISSVAQVDEGVAVLFPNLADPGWLPGNFRLEPGDLAYHQLRFFFGRRPDNVPSSVELTEAYPCHESDGAMPMVNATETSPAMHFEIDLSSVQGISNESDYGRGDDLPILGEVIRSANWPRRQRVLDENYLLPALTLKEARHLGGRLLLKNVDLRDLKVIPRQQGYRLNGKQVPMPVAITLTADFQSQINLCLRDLTLDTGLGNCLTWNATEDVLLLVEHQPPRTIGLGCLGGRRDFIAHYALLKGVGALPALPMPVPDTGKKGYPGPADDAMCSPARVR